MGIRPVLGSQAGWKGEGRPPQEKGEPESGTGLGATILGGPKSPTVFPPSCSLRFLMLSEVIISRTSPPGCPCKPQPGSTCCSTQRREAHPFSALKLPRTPAYGSASPGPASWVPIPGLTALPTSPSITNTGLLCRSEFCCGSPVPKAIKPHVFMWAPGTRQQGGPEMAHIRNDEAHTSSALLGERPLEAPKPPRAREPQFPAR